MRLPRSPNPDLSPNFSTPPAAEGIFSPPSEPPLGDRGGRHRSGRLDPRRMSNTPAVQTPRGPRWRHWNSPLCPPKGTVISPSVVVPRRRDHSSSMIASAPASHFPGRTARGSRKTQARGAALLLALAASACNSSSEPVKGRDDDVFFPAVRVTVPFIG